MIRLLMRSSLNHYWLKKSSFYLLLSLSLTVSAIRAAEATSNEKAIPNTPLPFDVWTQNNKKFLTKHGIYSSRYAGCSSKCKFDSPRRLSIAGLLFLIDYMPPEMQREIGQYLIDDLSPFITGISAKDLSINATLDHPHLDSPYIKHGYPNTVECSHPRCIPQNIDLENGYYKNSTVRYVPPLINYLWRLMKAKAANQGLPKTTIIAVDRYNNTIFTGHGYDTSSHGAPTHYWTIANPSATMQMLGNPMTHDFDLADILALRIANHALRQKRKSKKTPSPELSANSIEAFANLKTKFKKLKTENGIPIEPLFLNDELSNQKRRVLRRENAFIDNSEESK